MGRLRQKLARRKGVLPDVHILGPESLTAEELTMSYGMMLQYIFCTSVVPSVEWKDDGLHVLHAGSQYVITHMPNKLATLAMLNKESFLKKMRDRSNHEGLRVCSLVRIG